MNDAKRKQMVAAEFVARFGQQPELGARAPGRVDLMGSHTDYNQGYVMTMTIDRDTWIAARPRDDRQVNIYSLNLDGGGTFEAGTTEKDTGSPWTDYVRGVAWALAEAGHLLRGFDGLVHSTIPFNSGLSSSAAIEMATAIMFQMVGDFSIDPVDMALLGQKAENEFVGVNSGILDQYSSALGEAGCALLLDCRTLTSTVAPIAPGVRVVICDTRAQRNLIGTEYDDRRAQCEQGVRYLRRYYPGITHLRDLSPPQVSAQMTELPDVIARRCRFIVEENQRVLDLAPALSTGDRQRLHNLLAESYHGARDLYEIGAPAMEHMMQAMLGAPGVIGARQAGAGFGGCMVALVEIEQVENFRQHVMEAYAASTDVEPHVYAVAAAAGAGPLVL